MISRQVEGVEKVVGMSNLTKLRIGAFRPTPNNTINTINALNEVIREKNGGVLDKSYMVDWLEFENTLLLTNEIGLQKIPTKIFQIIDTTTWGKK